MRPVVSLRAAGSTMRLAVLLAVILVATPARAWDDATGSLDLPWLGSGERARLYAKKTSCLMCTTGYEYHQSWGRSGRTGSDPYSDVQRAFGFLQKRGVLDTWPEASVRAASATGRRSSSRGPLRIASRSSCSSRRSSSCASTSARS